MQEMKMMFIPIIYDEGTQKQTLTLPVTTNAQWQQQLSLIVTPLIHCHYPRSLTIDLSPTLAFFSLPSF